MWNFFLKWVSNQYNFAMPNKEQMEMKHGKPKCVPCSTRTEHQIPAYLVFVHIFKKKNTWANWTNWMGYGMGRAPEKERKHVWNTYLRVEHWESWAWSAAAAAGPAGQWPKIVRYRSGLWDLGQTGDTTKAVPETLTHYKLPG